MRFGVRILRQLVTGLLLTATVSTLALAQAADPVVEAARAAGTAGEQADGYLGVRGGNPDLARRVSQINIQRRAAYTDIAAGKTGVTVVDVGAATACQLFATRVTPGQYYRSPNGEWLQRGAAPIALPGYCGR